MASSGAHAHHMIESLHAHRLGRSIGVAVAELAVLIFTPTLRGSSIDQRAREAVALSAFRGARDRFAGRDADRAGDVQHADRAGRGVGRAVAKLTRLVRSPTLHGHVLKDS